MNEAQRFERDVLKSRLKYLADQVTDQQIKLIGLHTNPETTVEALGRAYLKLHTLQGGVDELIREARDGA